MSKGPCGYGRYDSDPGWVGCPRAKSSESPCIARDGKVALADDGACVMCNTRPGFLLKQLRTEGCIKEISPPQPSLAADLLRDVVYRITEPRKDTP